MFYFQLAPAVEYLLHSYPEFVSVESIPLETLDQKVCLNIPILLLILTMMCQIISSYILEFNNIISWTIP